MKRISQIAIAVVFLFLIVACSNIEKGIEAYVEEENKVLPFEYGGELVLEECVFDKVNVIYRYKLPEVAITPEEAEELKATFLCDEALEYERFVQLLTMLADGGYGLVYEYSDYRSNSITITFTPEEIKESLSK